MKQSVAPSRTTTVATYAIVAILTLVPFNTLLTTWAGSNFGHLDLFRVIKELIMLPLGVYGAILVYQSKPLLRRWQQSWLVRCVVLYGVFFAAYAGLELIQGTTTPSAVWFSLVTNIRFLWLFLTVWAICSFDPRVRLWWPKIVLVPASLVVVFGIAQRLLLPSDFLRHFGYGPDTISPVATVDQKLAYQRVQSTLRGANPLGAYLIVPILTALAFVRRHLALVGFIGLAFLTLFFTYSRSAWIGLTVAVMVFLWRQANNEQRRGLVVAVGVGLVLAFSGIWLLRDNNFVQNTVFHSDETSQSAVSSNEQRLSSLKAASREIIQQSFGAGPGTAGPASFRNNQPARIAENYYLQIGQEVGLIGLGLFVAITILVGRQLLRSKALLAQVLFASLVGITVINLISHAWTDDALSIIWWGLAGAAMTLPDILNRKRNKAN